MKNKILVVYQFATFGGVERVLLNRAEAFKYYKKDCKLFIYFYEDYGAKDALKKYIVDNNLINYIEIVDEINLDEYDQIISIDTPKILKDKKLNLSNVIIETHTFEQKYRKYLDEYGEKVKRIIVPSNQFKNQLYSENPILKEKNKVYVIDNFVPWEMKKTSKTITLPEWGKKLIFYFGRMDGNKNTKELIKAFKLYLKTNDDALLILVGKMDPLYNLEDYIVREGLQSKIVYYPPISFNNTDVLLNTLKEKKAVFISTSRGETFSLSAAEAIAKKMPVILSDIQAHKDLVDNNTEFLYEMGDYKLLAEKIKKAFDEYDDLAKEVEKYKEGFSAKKFIDQWSIIFDKSK